MAEKMVQVCEYCGGWGVFIPSDWQQYYQLDGNLVLPDAWMPSCEVICSHCNGTGVIAIEMRRVRNESRRQT